MSDDLDTQIRRAEMTVVESDRRLLQTARQLAPASRGAAQRAAWIGGGSLAVIASTWLVVRALSRPAPPPPWWSARKAASPPPPPPANPPSARGWRRAMELGGALMGSALRSGLAPAAPKTAAAAPLAFATAWRWFSQRRATRR
ncbi:hypothetical protein [Rhizobacter sp. Root404]|uniref:hypothetical protein n=1 Tax=Rhizobacter sp. Root404 TaxID=1736528 RepID=UPI0006FE1D3E|nr:hypothetical protein [Rhizobacter sp. Root404]KQW37994.1 hypothetical protein ASC76_07950 [Rhizobacter sp. Root404]